METSNLFWKSEFLTVWYIVITVVVKLMVVMMLIMIVMVSVADGICVRFSNDDDGDKIGGGGDVMVIMKMIW